MPAPDLNSALAIVTERPVNFAFYRGQDADLMLVTPNPPTPKELAKAEEECGKLSCVLKGLCSRIDGKLVFAIRLDPAPAWEMMLAEILKERKCAHFLPIQVRQLRPDEPEEVFNPEGNQGYDDTGLDDLLKSL
jgi:hypothetical protein